MMHHVMPLAAVVAFTSLAIYTALIFSPGCRVKYLSWKMRLGVRVPNNPAAEITEALRTISAGEQFFGGGVPGSCLDSACLGNCSPK